jgi:hypothetical protein
MIIVSYLRSRYIVLDVMLDKSASFEEVACLTFRKTRKRLQLKRDIRKARASLFNHAQVVI